MIKRILTGLIIYTICIVLIISFLPSESGSFIIGLVLTGLLFGIFIVYEVYKKYSADLLPSAKVMLPYTDHSVSDLRKISYKPFLFGFEKKIVSGDDVYFDQDSIYMVNPMGKSAKFSLYEITALKRTSVRINNSTIWQISLMDDGKPVTVKFAPNFSLANKNFLQFYTLLKEINPNAVQSEWNLWKI